MIKGKGNKWFGKTSQLFGKNKSQSLSHSLYQNKLEMIKIWSHKSNRRKNG